MTDEDVQVLIPIIENVGRLTDDATHLVRANSFPSAFVLTAIALEELGKVIQLRLSQLDIKHLARNDQLIFKNNGPSRAY